MYESTSSPLEDGIRLTTLYEQLGKVLAQRVDLEGVDFLKNQFVASGARYETEFNVTPIASFSGTPTEWRREIRSVINFMASKMVDDFFYNNGHLTNKVREKVISQWNKLLIAGNP